MIELPKDKVLEYYRSQRSSPLTPFSEYLFACSNADDGERLCALMKVFSRDKRAHVLWKINAEGARVAEYVLFSREALSASPELPQELSRVGFTPLVYSLEAL